MSLPRITDNMNIIVLLEDLPNDVGGLTAADLKAKFDEHGVKIKDFINLVMILALESVADGSSGADQIGAGPLFVGDTTDGNIMAKLIYSYQQFLTVVQGGIADGSVTPTKLSFTPAMYKNGSGTFPVGTTCTVTDAFITADTQVIISPTQEPQGAWSVVSAAGSFTITSDTSESSTVTFDWGATK